MLVMINVSTSSKEIAMMAGMVIGGWCCLKHYLLALFTNASMNSAQSLTPNVVSGNIKGLWLYITAPLLGVLLAVIGCRFVKYDSRCNEKC